MVKARLVLPVVALPESARAQPVLLRQEWLVEKFSVPMELLADRGRLLALDVVEHRRCSVQADLQ